MQAGLCERAGHIAQETSTEKVAHITADGMAQFTREVPADG